MIGLDLETRPTNGAPREYALQPWRYLEGTAEAWCCSCAKATGEAFLVTNTKQYKSLLQKLQGKTVVTWNGVFDIAWLVAMGHYEQVNKINWVDGMILWKWLDNSQEKDRFPRWSLADGCERFFGKTNWGQKFIKMKKNERDDDQYWEQRAKLDAIVTCRIAEHILADLTDRQRKSAMITMASLVPAARSWVFGVRYNFALSETLTPAVTTEMEEIERTLGVRNPSEPWQPSKVLRSTAKLGALLFNQWGLHPINYSEKTNKPSTDKQTLTYLADNNPQVASILRWRELNTQLSKYLESPSKAQIYLGTDVMHPSPSIFSTYTGRMTYSSKTQRKYPTGIALHQWPRNKALRALIEPEDGFMHVEFDAAGQESRIMAEQSGDVNMLNTFMEGKDIHSMTGASLAGMSYEDFMKAKMQGNKRVVGEHGFRYQGKFTNLSNNFRIGVKKLRVQARVQYGMDVDFPMAKQWQDTFFRLYPGIKNYWQSAIDKGTAYRYAETLAGRRLRLDYWDENNKWSTESSAIMHPIQGTGADMKDLAIQEIHKHYPEFIFWFDLHDGLHYQVPVDTPIELVLECREMLNDLDYEVWWGYKPSVPFTWDASVGPRWSELKELK